MIALLGYQFTEFRRTRYWLGVLIGYLAFLLLFYLRTARNHPGSYGNAGVALLAAAIGLGWTLAASQDPARWQIMVVAAGSRDRAVLSRVLLAFALVVPLSALAMLVAASHKLVTESVLSLVAALLLYLVVGLIGCLVGTELGRRMSPRSIMPITVVVSLILLIMV
ncbi:MAG: hypothetical protein ABI140_10055 [Jatrophihabitantaceae bacterium]